VKFQVTGEPVSFRGRLHRKGEELEATEEQMAGFLQAGYVKALDKPKDKRRRAPRNKGARH
jgi:hypothetical protein